MFCNILFEIGEIMRREKKLKPIVVDPDTYRLMCTIWAPHKVPYNPTIKEKEVKEKDVRKH